MPVVDLETAFLYAQLAALLTLIEMGVLLRPAVALGLVMHLVAGVIERFTLRRCGRLLYFVVFGVGTVFHELSHYLLCKVFQHQVEEFRVFNTDPASGAIGYVKHSWDKRSIYQQIGRFFIGVGPIMAAAALIYALATLLLGPLLPSAEITVRPALVTSFDAVVNLAGDVVRSAQTIMLYVLRPEHADDWRLWAFIGVSFQVGSAIRLSYSDIRGAFTGFLFLTITWLAFNLATVWNERFSDILLDHLTTLSGMAVSALVIAASIQLIASVAVLGAATLARSRARRR